MVDPPLNDAGSPPASRWAVIGGILLFVLIVCLVIDVVFRQAVGSVTAPNATSAIPGALGASTGVNADSSTSPYTLVPFPTSTRIVTITPPKPRTSTPRPGARPSPTPIRYKVRSGDTLGSIAKKFGVTTQALIRANGLQSENLSIGQTLIIPSK